MPARTIVYSSLGPELEVFELDPETGALARIQTYRFDVAVQSAWPNRARTKLYVISSDAGPMAKVKGPNHFVQAFDIGPTGAIEPACPPVRLRHRALYICLDADETHLLIAYNDPSGVTVHRIEADGSVGPEVEQPPLEFGVTVHQVRVTPHGTIVVVPSCAHHEVGAVPGLVDIFSYEGGRLSPLARMHADPGRAAKWQGVKHGAHGFAPRHVDFHPTRPWMYMCVERQGELRLYDYDEEHVELEPRFIRSTLEGVPSSRSAQLASGIRVHPSGRYVYVSNRANETERVGDVDVFVGGVNDISVFEIDEVTGEPTLIQHAETLGIYPRTFGIDANGRVLVAGNEQPIYAREGDTIRRVVPSLVVFRIGDDGRLTLLNKHDHPDNGEVCFFVDVITLHR